MTTTILQNGETVLREKAADVPLSDITREKIQKVLKEMQAALIAQDDGVALAAPQIGVPLRIFIVSKAALSFREKQKGGAEYDAGDAKSSERLKSEAGFLTFINPVITKLSREKALLDEGCLSVRPLYGKIKRAKKATIRAYDEQGIKSTLGASGLLAQIFQHECDHLDGVLFIDKATDLRELPLPNSKS